MGGFFAGPAASYSNLTGASATAAGTSGLVPAPAAGDQTAFLSGSGSFIIPAVGILSKDSAQTQDVGAVGGSSSVFWGCPFVFGGSTGSPPSTLKPLFCPIYIPKTDTFNRISVTISTGAANTLFSLAIYSLNASTGFPDTLVASANSLSGASAATVEGTISQSLNQGWYWSSIMVDSTSIVFRVENSQTVSFIGSNLPWSGSARNPLRLILTNARSSISDWPSSITRNDITVGQNAAVAFVQISVRKV